MTFYDNPHVLFVTGATGFIGKTLVEKILRSLPQVRKIYILVRANDDTKLRERVEKEIFGTPLFGTLKARFPKSSDFKKRIMSKVVPVRGDLQKEHLGLSEQDRAMVQSDTSVIINCAAYVRYFLPLIEALNVNCYGTHRVLELAQGMPHLTSIVHVSTSFVNPHLGDYQNEELYPYPLGEADQLLKQWQAMSEDDMATYERDVALKVYPNTYTCSKALTEHMVQSWSRSMNLPSVIVRPAIVIGAHSEPIPGWADSGSGMNAIVVLSALGDVPDWVADENLVVDVIPVDFVCKNILMAATAAKRGQYPIPIFHSGSSGRDPVTYKQIFKPLSNYWPQARAKIIESGTTSKIRIRSKIEVSFCGLDEFETRFPKKHAKDLQLVKEKVPGYEKIERRLTFAYNTGKIFAPFMTDQWFWDDRNTIELDDQAPEVLRIGLRDGIDWDAYVLIWHMGLHEFVVGEKVDRATMLANYRLSRGDHGFLGDQDRKQVHARL